MDRGHHGGGTGGVLVHFFQKSVRMPERPRASGSAPGPVGIAIARRIATASPAKEFPAQSTTQPGDKFSDAMDFFEFVFWRLPKQMITYYLGETPGHYAQMMEDEQSPDLRRDGRIAAGERLRFCPQRPVHQAILANRARRS